MKISDRLADYGFIGAVFWMLQLGVLLVSARNTPNWTMYFQDLKTALGALPVQVIAPVSAFLGASAIVVIFATGVVIDLFFAPFGRVSEAASFRSFARKNACWMKPLLAERFDCIQDDWDLLLQSSILADLRQRRSRAAVTRVQSFLIAYILLMSDSSQTEVLTTQMSLWSIARGITGAGVVISFEMLSLLRHRNLLDPFLFFAVAFLVLGGAATYFARNRVWSTLFALVYVTNLKSTTTQAVPRTVS